MLLGVEGKLKTKQFSNRSAVPVVMTMSDWLNVRQKQKNCYNWLISPSPPCRAFDPRRVSNPSLLAILRCVWAVLKLNISALFCRLNFRMRIGIITCGVVPDELVQQYGTWAGLLRFLVRYLSLLPTHSVASYPHMLEEWLRSCGLPVTSQVIRLQSCMHLTTSKTAAAAAVHLCRCFSRWATTMLRMVCCPPHLEKTMPT